MSDAYPGLLMTQTMMPAIEHLNLFCLHWSRLRRLGEPRVETHKHFLNPGRCEVKATSHFCPYTFHTCMC